MTPPARHGAIHKGDNDIAFQARRSESWFGQGADSATAYGPLDSVAGIFFDECLGHGVPAPCTSGHRC
jgi:hypothetical protein